MNHFVHLDETQTRRLSDVEELQNNWRKRNMLLYFGSRTQSVIANENTTIDDIWYNLKNLDPCAVM